MPRRRIIYALLTLSALLLLGVGQLRAQFYPVHASVVWASPRTPYLPDLYSGSRDRLVITLTNRDATQPVLHVRMRVRIRCGTSELRSREELPYPHIVLTTGIPHRITNTDLAAYLQPDRLTNAHILRNGQLPDGFTEISVQAVDLFTGKALSDWHSARGHLSVNKPPFLIAPERDATVALTEPTAILFRWQPRLASATEYEFTLKELPSTGESPQGAFPYGHVVHRETVRGTMLSYTHLHPPLIANRLYAWQIRAIQRDGIDEVSTYENGGYSEVSWFRLTDGCTAPTHLHAHPRYAKVELRWRDAPKAASYTIQIRPKTRLGIYEWQAFSNVSSPNTIRGLQPGRTYEWRVGASCTDIEPVYSEVEEFTLSTENEELLRDCGKVPEIPKGVSQEPHLAIKVGDVVTVGGDYPLTITEIEPLGDGWYAGRGRTQLRAIMYIPLAMRFDSLRINVDYRQIGGAVEAMSREDSKFLFDDDAEPEPPSLHIRELDFTLADTPGFTFDPQTGELRTIDAHGNPQTIALEVPQNGWESAFPMKIADDDGNMYELTLGERGEDEVQQIVVRDLHIEDEPYDASALSGYHWALDSLRLPNGSSIHEVRTGQAVRLALCHADRRLLDSIMLRVGDNTFKDTTATIRYTDYQTPITIQAQRKLQGRDTVVATMTINTHNAPILTFGTLSGYAGEFGYDDGEGLPTKDKVKNYPYRRLTIQSETNAVSKICPFISIGNAQSAAIKAEIIVPEQIKNQYEYNAQLVAYRKGNVKTVDLPYNKKTLCIEYSEESDSMFVSIYQRNKHNKKVILLGQCEVIQRKFIGPPIDVKVIHYQTKKENINITNTETIQEFLNNHSHNQMFLQYNVSLFSDCITVIDTTFIDRINKSQKNSKRNLSTLILHTMIETILERTKLTINDFSPAITSSKNKNRTLYLIATDCKRKSVTGSSGGACMVIYSMDKRSQENFNHTIAHEFGHCVGLQHPFEDDDLCKPTQGECKSNFMDYVEKSFMFFKSQILTVLNGLYVKLNNEMKKIFIIFLCCIFSFIVNAQSIERINYVLDSVEFYNYSLNFNYWEKILLPDSVKKKMINVLNGYLPPQRIQKAQKFTRAELQTITSIAKKKCKDDIECVKKEKLSIKNQYIEDRIRGSKESEFTPAFILALGGWDVHESKQILWENRNNTKRFPEVETYMALARFGYSEAIDSVMKWMCFDIYSDDISYLYSERYIKKTITNFAFTAKYLRCKQFFMRIIDLFDLETYGQDPIWNTEDDSFYPSESIIFEILLKRRFEGLEEKFPTAYDELKDIRYKWESFMPTIYDKEEEMKFNKEMEYMYWIMPAISNKGLNFINDVCDRKIIIDVDSKTVETIEKICSDDVSDIELDHLINVLKTFCTDDIDEKDIRCFVEMKQFRQSGLKEQMKAEVREWINKYVTFDE